MGDIRRWVKVDHASDEVKLPVSADWADDLASQDLRGLINK